MYLVSGLDRGDHLANWTPDEALPSITAAGRTQLDTWFATLKVARVHFDDESAFRNINTLDELQQFDTDPV